MKYKINPDGTVTIIANDNKSDIKFTPSPEPMLSDDWMEYDDHKLFK